MKIILTFLILSISLFSQTPTTKVNGSLNVVGSVTSTNGFKGGTGTKSISLPAPVVGDNGLIQIMFEQAVTITRIACNIKGSTSVSINLDERAAATPDTAGTSVLGSALVCDADQEVTTTFSDAAIAANVPLTLIISAISGTPETLRVFITYKVNE